MIHPGGVGLVGAVLTVVAVVIGYWLTSDLDPFWTAITVIIVMQPDLDKTLFKAAQRGLGTLVGVATTTAVIEVVNSGPDRRHRAHRHLRRHRLLGRTT